MQTSVPRTRSSRLVAAAAGICLWALAAAVSWAAPAAASKSFLYVISNIPSANTIAAYQRDPVTGRLSGLQTYPTGGKGAVTAVAISQGGLATDGTYLYAVNPGSNTISAFIITGTGALQPVGSPVSSSGVLPVSLALHGNLLYVANRGDNQTPANYTGFRVRSGLLAPLSNSTVTLGVGDNPSQVLFNPSGSVLIGTRYGNSSIDSFFVNRQGGLIPAATYPNSQLSFSAQFRPTAADQLFVSLAQLPGIGSFQLSRGSLVPLSTAGNAPELLPCWVTSSPDGSRFWTSNTGSNSVTLFTAAPDGTLSLASSRSTLAFGTAPVDLATDSAGQYLYLVLAANRKLHQYQLNGQTTDAGLKDIDTVDLPSGSYPFGIAIVDR